MLFWRKPEPPPEKLWIQKPAWVTIVITLITILVLGPVGMIWNGMAEEQKQHRDAIVQNQLAIKELLTRQQMMLEQKKELVNPNLQVRPLTGPKATVNKNSVTLKKVLTPEQFEKYLSMKPDVQVKYKKYLESRGYDTEGLP